MIKLAATRAHAALALTIVLSGAGIAGAANAHRAAITPSGGGSEGATAYVQTSSTGSALQGEVASTANTGLKLPFGILGEYDASSSTFGVGVIGLSTSGYGVAAETLSDAQPSILGDPGGNGIGIEGVQPNPASTSPAIYAETKSGGDAVEGIIDNRSLGGGGYRAGVAGYDTTGQGFFGVFGESMGGVGVQGIAEGASTAAIMGETVTSGAGVYGINDNTATPSPTGLTPDYLAGVSAIARGGPAGYFFGVGVGDGIDVSTTGNLGANIASSGSAGIGLSAYGTDIGFETSSSTENGYPDQAIDATGRQFGVIATTTASGTTYPLYLQSPAGLIAYVDGTGALYLHNGVHSFARTRDGGSVESFTPRSSAPTVEDVGEGQLVGGSAIVKIDAALGASLDQRVAYHVFLTPEAETNGLYVARKTPDYFVVRELHGGRNSLAFDYRVVGAIEGQAGARMTLRAAHNFSETVTVPRAAAVVRPIAKPRLTLATKRRGYAPFIAPPVRAPLAKTPNR